MTTEVDIESLVGPISEESPAGIDLRDDDNPNNIFRRVKDARNAARQEESQAELDGGSSPEARRLWREVWNEGLDYLRTQAKDLEIAAYLIEASIRLDGYRGFKCALDITTELVNRFWGELLPTPDEDGIETTILPISRLNGDVIVYPLMRVGITADGSFGPLAIWQYHQAQQLEGMDNDERELRVSRGAITLAQFNQAIAETPAHFFQELYADLQATKEALIRLDAAFNEKAGYEFAPNFSKSQSSLADAERVLNQIAGDKLTAATEPEGEDTSDANQSSDANSSAGAGNSNKKKGGITTREEAFQELEKIAQWIEIHEPQSLMPSEIRKVIRRGRMTPMELYQDLITDRDVRRSLYRDVGIEDPEQDSY